MAPRKYAGPRAQAAVLGGELGGEQQVRADRCGAPEYICRASGTRSRRQRERGSRGGTRGAVEGDLTSPKGHSPEPEVLAPTPSLSSQVKRKKPERSVTPLHLPGSNR